MPKKALKKRKDGRYLCWYMGVPFYGKTSDEALEARDQYRLRMKAGLREEALGKTVAQYSAEWLPIHKDGVGNRTYNDYAHYLNMLCDAMGTCRMRDVVSSNIKELFNSQRGKSGSHIRKFCMLINSMFASAVADNIILKNPCLDVKRPDGEDGTHRCLDPWEISLVESMVGEHPFAAAAMGMLYGGMRIGEAIAFDMDRDIDFAAGVISIRENVIFESNQPIVKAPKTKAGLREAPLFDPFRNAVAGRHGLLLKRQTPTLQPSTGVENRLSQAAFSSLWSSFKTAMETKLNGCQKRWYGLTKEHKTLLAAGEKLPPWREVRIRTHDFRHTYCTMLYNAGVDIKTTMKWMGHADEKMIIRIYAHLTSEREKAEALAVANHIKMGGYSQKRIQVEP